GLELAGERHRLRAGLPRVEHAVACFAQALDLLVLELDPGRHDELVVLERAFPDPHAVRGGLDGAGQLVNDAHPMPAQPRVVERDGVERAYAAQHEVAEGTRYERLVRLEEDDLDRWIAEPHVLRRGRAAPAAADHH